MSMEVKDKSAKDRRVAQGDATRSALLTAARTLFGSQGYAATSLDAVVAGAGVTKGALYHHFDGKEAVFSAVFEQIQQEVSDTAVAAFNRPDSWEALLEGCGLWLDAHLDPEVQRIVLREARAVLGWEDVRTIENRFGAVALRGALRKAMHAGAVERQPLRPLSLMLLGSLGEACQYIADAEDPAAARAEVAELIPRLLAGFRAPPESPA